MHERSVPAPRGFRGARLGPPYEFSWVDKEPTSKTWEEAARQRGCLWLVVGLPCVVYIVFQFGGSTGLVLLFLISALPVFLLFELGRTRGRSDGEPVPKLVRREAWIEHEDGVFHFSLAVNGRPQIWEPWELVGQFERADYWPMFGDAGASPYKTGWHAIVMTPPVGPPWLIASTIEAEAEVRDRFSKLDARFSADARTRFLRQVEAQKKKSSEGSQPNTFDTSSNPSGVPDRL
jgi:hypothetical protein